MPRRVVLTRACIEGIGECLRDTAAAEHEGVAYLVGLVGDSTTLGVAAIRPAAQTTAGSFDVDGGAMARVVRVAVDQSLEVVGQVHTHPSLAFHSDGDVEGTRIRHEGYMSIVLPNYGRDLPAFEGAACYLYESAHHRFRSLNSNDVCIVDAHMR